jgi:hypothetical protein
MYMNQQKVQQAFKQSAVKPDVLLADSIWNTIVVRMERRRQVKLWAYRVVSVASVVALVPAVKMLAVESASSGFSEYSSLLFSHAALASSLKELTLVLAETVPVTSVVICLALVLSLGYALRVLSHIKKYPTQQLQVA